MLDVGFRVIKINNSRNTAFCILWYEFRNELFTTEQGRAVRGGR